MAAIDLILKNKEWIFSGLGVSIIAFIFFVLKKIFFKKEDARNNFEIKVVMPDQQITKKNNEDKTEVEKISSRFKTCLSLMNAKRRYAPFTVAWIAKQLEFEKISDLENIFLNKSEASFELIEKFSEMFGVSCEWLLEGRGEPFSSNIQRKLFPLDCFEEIKSSKAETIFFVRAKTVEGQTIIVLKLCEYKFLVYGKDWHISDQVGGTGQQQLVSFYKLIKKLVEFNLSIKCNGILLEKEDFYNLLNGKIFPGEFLNNVHSINTWWEDLLDYNHACRSEKAYEQLYGTSFIRAQELLKSMLKESIVGWDSDLKRW